MPVDEFGKALPEPRDDRARAPGFDDALRGSISTGGYSAEQLRRARDVLARLAGLRHARRLYPDEHPAVSAAARDLLEVVSSYHAEGSEVTLAFYDGEVFLGDVLLAEDSIMFDQLIRDMASIGAGSLAFLRGVDVDELGRLAAVLVLAPPDVMAIEGGIATIVSHAHLPHVSVGAVSIVREDLISTDDIAAAKTAYTGGLDLMRHVDRLIRSSRSIASGHIKGTAHSLVDNVLRNRGAMLELSGLKSFDEYTFYHSVNVAILALALGSMITRDYRFLASLGTGALLHDMGKSRIDNAVLNKQGPLTSSEWEEVRKHPVYGAEVVAVTPGLDRSAIVCVLEHHMRYDMAGYPERTPARPQHLASRIVAVADAYDAMTSLRPYSAPRLQPDAMAIIARDAGSALDPALVRLFVRALGYYPPRSLVQLDSGETAVVVRPTAADPARPLVRIIAGVDGRICEPVDVDLSDEDARAGRTIASCIDPSVINIEVADFLYS